MKPQLVVIEQTRYNVLVSFKMVKGNQLHLYSAFIQNAFQGFCRSFTHSCTHSHTNSSNQPRRALANYQEQFGVFNSVFCPRTLQILFLFVMISYSKETVKNRITRYPPCCNCSHILHPGHDLAPKSADLVVGMWR